MADLLSLVEGSLLWRLGAAASIGLLIGVERERQKRAGRQADAGMRTFTLVSLMGGLAAQTGSDLVTGSAVLFAVAIALLTRMRSGSRQQGMTTQVALVIVAILGVLAQTRPGEAIAVAVAVVMVMSNGVPLHRFARDWLTEREVRDGFLFATAALVVLPVLPDRAIDPLNLVNPFALWRLAIVLMGVSAFSHFATRILGPRYGLAISGFAGGFVSSTASIAALGSLAKGDRHLVQACASGAVASILGSLLFLVILVGAADPGILRPLLAAFAVAGALVLGYSAFLAWRVNRTNSSPAAPSRAFDFRTTLIFVGLVSVFSLLSWALIAEFGNAMIFASVVGTALIDAHAAAVSVATLIAGGKLSAGDGSLAILFGFSANMLAKAPTAFALGRAAYGMRVSFGLCLLVAGLWGGYAWQMVIG